ncbi:MAG TPA: enoyl-CoA hydratase [Usitatibacter sp.]|nr:enoyl-CoA hydratase [Usitatibacter sp.]
MEIVASREGGVLEIALDRPQKKNAITVGMYADLARTLREAEADENVRVVLFRGNGDSFCAGNDLEDFAANPPASVDAPVFRFLGTASQATKPFVAAVHGSAVGIGTTLLLHCELVYAADDARFSLPFTRLGLVPEFASSYLLPLFAGYHRAAELLLLGEPFDARVAYEAGFVTRVVPKELVVETAREAARKLAALPPKSVQRTKILMRGPHAAAVELQRKAEAEWFRPMLGEPAARAALEAFLARRKG